MPRISPNFAAAFAAILITVVTVHAVTFVPPAQAAVLAVPTLA